MNRLYSLFFLLLVSNGVNSQVIIEAVELPDSRYQFVNKITGLKIDDHVWNETEPFVNGFAKVAEGDKWGFVDRQGNPLINVKYESVRNFINNLAAVKQNSKWGFIDERGSVIIPFEYDLVYDFTEQVTAAFKNNKWFLINRQGATIKSLDIDIFWGFKKGLARISFKGRKGIMNTQGQIISMDSEKAGLSKQKNSAIYQNNSLQAAICPDNIGFENGNFTNWNCFVGDVEAVGNANVITVTPSQPTANRHSIYAASNPSALDPYGLFPTNPPDGSGFALKLGNSRNGAEAERVRYQINVPTNSTEASITYRYAVVFQDPGHQTFEQPRFSAKLLDVSTNTYLPCASYEYISDGSLSGFYNSTIEDSVKCKAWASVFINLSAYAGRSLILEFTTADCTKGAHWGYAYVDVGDCNITADVKYQCNPNMATLSGPPGFINYKWWDNNFSTLLGTGQNLIMSPAPVLNSTVHVEVIPINGLGCSDTLHVVVSNSTPTADAGPDKIICQGTTTTIGTAAVAGNTYSWLPSDFLSNPNLASPTSSSLQSKTYILSVRNTANGCTDQDTVNVTVHPKPSAIFDPGADQCLAGNSFTFTNKSTFSLQYDWNFGDGEVSTIANPVHNFKMAQAYPVKLLATGTNGCADSILHTITVHANPVITGIKDISICRGATVQLQTTGAQLYEWTPAQDLSCSDCPNPNITPIASGTYVVKGTNSFGCPAYDTVVITVFQPIKINVSPDIEICNEGSVNLLASGASTYKWFPSQSLSNDVIANPVAFPSSTTQYRVIGYDDHNCFTDTGFVSVTVNPKPSIELGVNRSLTTGTIYPLNPVTSNGPITSWEWTPATNLSCSDCPNPSATVKNDITYYAQIKNIFGCAATDSIFINTFCEGSQVFIPNAFSPDGDGINDILMVRAKGIQSIISFRIFTRWGEQVFERTNFSPNVPAFGWDGRIRGVTGPAEVYIYTAIVTCDNLQTYTFKGNISLLK